MSKLEQIIKKSDTVVCTDFIDYATGYILQDGTCVNLVSKMTYDEGGHRDDHGKISHFMRAGRTRRTKHSTSCAMVRFINRGNIRWKPENDVPACEFQKIPTRQQLRVIADMVNPFDDRICFEWVKVTGYTKRIFESWEEFLSFCYSHNVYL